MQARTAPGADPDPAHVPIAPGSITPGPVAPAPPGPGGRSWRDLRVRLVSAAVLAPIGLACIWFGGWLFAMLVMLGVAGIGSEWAALLRHRPVSLRGLVLIGWPVIACLAALLTGRWDEAVMMLVAPVLLGLSVAAGTLVTGVAGLALLWLRFMTATGWDSVLFVLLVVWSSDSGAYLVGRAAGGPKLAPRISPGKTWSGSVGGLAAAALVGALLASLLPAPGGIGPVAAAFWGAVTGLLLGVVSQAGDLAESAFKRRAGVKDSGHLIPGHGGLLDRFDGLLAAAPLAVALSLLVLPGNGFWYGLDPWAGPTPPTWPIARGMN